MTSNRIIKLAAALSCILIVIGLFEVWNSPATDYESSIYTSTSPVFWVALVFSLICGIGIVVHQIYTKQYEKSRLWSLGLLLIFIDYVGILSLWIIRGYAMWCPWDPSLHLGIIQEVLSSGHIASSNCYPITHIYIAQISSVLGISPIFPYKYIPLIFGIMFVPFMYLFAKSVLREKGQVIFATLASMALLYGWYFNLTPNHLSNLFLPLAMFLLVKSWFSKGIAWKILIIIMVFLLVPFHPVPSLALFLMAFTIWLSQRRFIRSTQSATTVRGNLVAVFNVTLILLMIIWIITWISSFGIWDATIRNIHTIVTEGGMNHLDILKGQIDYAQGFGYSVIQDFFKIYTGVVLYIVLAIVAFPILRRRIRSEPDLGKLFSLYRPLAAYALSIVVLFFFNFLFGPLRLLVYITVLCTPFVGFMLYEVLKSARHFKHGSLLHKLAIGLILVVPIGVSITGAMAVYPSSYIYETNWQITRTEISGMDWFLHNKDVNKEITSLSISPGIFARFLLTPEQRIERQDLLRLKDELHVTEELNIPYHFGYDEHSRLGDYYSQEVYLILNQFNRVIYEKVYPEMAEFRFLTDDFEKLEQDRSIDKLYSNGGFDTYTIQGLASPF